VVYARPIHQSRSLTFGVSGMLWRASLIMFDRETRSLWSHITGKAVAGPLEGMKLRMLPAIHTTWGLWHRTHPDTQVLDKRGRYAPAQPHRWEATYALGLVVDAEAVGFPFHELGRQPLAHLTTAGIPLLVVYIEPAATAVAFRREVAGRALTFRRLAHDGARWRMEDRETGSRWNAVTGEAVSGPLEGKHLGLVPATQAYLSSWRQLHPTGKIWSASP
jgi:hypothetical protein